MVAAGTGSSVRCAFMRRTRILATIGPSSSDTDVIRQLLDAGADAFRLNFSHGTHDTHRDVCQRIRAAAEGTGRHVAILQDLGGPKIRTGLMAQPLRLEPGDVLTIERGHFAGGPGLVSCNFDALFDSVSSGDRLLLDDGRIELEVKAADPDRLITAVLSGGVLESQKGINVPGVQLRTSALTEKDLADLRAGVEMGVDLIAVSFVQTADDIRTARAAAQAAGAQGTPIIAKIEKPQAVRAIDEILAVADGIMVARGDLGVEVPLETVPALQRRLVLAARRRGVPVIVATQVLESMRTETRPTRAEVTDAANAVDQQVDAIMLAAETAVGDHPVKAVATLDAIIREAERVAEPTAEIVPEGARWSEHSRALCEAAESVAKRAHAAAIVAMTRLGKTARLMAAMRPPVRIFAVTPHSETAARLALVWGVQPVVMNERALSAVRETLVARNHAKTGDVVVMVSAHSSLGHEDINFVHVEKI